MPLTIDIRKSVIYQEGYAEGYAEGFAEVKAEGIAAGKAIKVHEIALEMLKAGKYSTEDIMQISKLTIQEIEAIKKDL